MFPAFVGNGTPFYRYNGNVLCWYCDSASTNEYWFCEHCRPHKKIHRTAKVAEHVDNGW